MNGKAGMGEGSGEVTEGEDVMRSVEASAAVMEKRDRFDQLKRELFEVRRVCSSAH